ncbi:MAG TPA: hypothetical protein VGV38_19450 [Pyrinomonadaceae bacterium]|nr:hypothetical protein [Pyrinomonadaceae bacterium]
MSQTNAAPPRPDVSRSKLGTRRDLVQPWYVSAKTFLVLWAALLLLVAGGVATLFARVPVYKGGVGIIVEGRDVPQYGRDELLLLAFLPPETLPRLSEGATLLLQPGPGKPRQPRQIIFVEKERLDADEAQRRLNLRPGLGLAIPQTSAVAVTPVLAPERDRAVLAGRVVRVELEVGTQPAGSFMPGVGRLFPR